VAKQVTVLTPGSTPQVALALREAASWVGSDTIAVERVDPPDQKATLEQALR
jgi:hypothetical protein